MPCVKRKLLALAAFALFTFFPNVSFAATQSNCECFCGVNGAGATDYGQLTNSACQSKCITLNKTTAGTQFVGCYADPQQYPDRNPKCWTEKECTTWSGMSGATPISATWQKGGQIPYDCTENKTSGDKTGYCYADNAKFKLNIPIGSLTEVSDIPTYINTVYTWLLPAAALIAVVMMMLGGLQYVMSRGKEKYISKSKERITNAITGLVLLLSVFVILNLIDPRLTLLNTLQIPMIKEVTILDATSSCERLEDYGYRVDVDPGKPDSCGGTGKITDVSGLKEGTLGSWKKDDSCDYTKCIDANANKSCVRSGDTNICVSCADYPAPSDSACNALEKLSKGENTQVYCENMSGLSCVTAGQSVPSKQGIDCADLKTKSDVIDTSTGERVGCRVYEALLGAYSAETPAGSGIRVGAPTITLGGVSIFAETKSFDGEFFKKICTEDLCEIADHVGKSNCTFNAGSAETGFFTDIANFWLGTTVATTGFYCHTF